MEKRQQEEEQKRVSEEQQLPALKQQFTTLSSTLNTTTDPSIQLQVAAELQQVAQLTKDIEVRIQHGATESEAADKKQAWSIQGGASGRYLDIVTMHHVMVPKDPNSQEVQDRIIKINECLAKLTTGDSTTQTPWKVIQAETVPHINTNEMRWRIGPIKHNINSREVAKRFHKIVVPTCFGNYGGLGEQKGQNSILR